MTDDLMTLMVQTGGQLSGQILHTMLTSTPALMSMTSGLLSPLLLIPYGFLIGAVPIIGTMIAVGILK